jgi:hypothetical protein
VTGVQTCALPILQICPANPPRIPLFRELSQPDGQARTSPSASPNEPDSAQQELLDLVGRWVAQRDVILGSKGLLTQDEQDLLRAFFEEHPGLVR